MSKTIGTPTLGQVIRAGIDRRINAMGSAQPGTVISYDELEGTCSVRLGTHRLLSSVDDPDVDLIEEYPALQDVPVCWLVGRGIQVKATLNKGDSVLVICLDRDASGWRRTGAPAEPEDARTHHWGSAVAVPGLVPRQSPFPEPSDSAALASKLDALITVLKTATVPGSVGGLVTTLFPGVSAPTTPFPGTTTGSSVLLLDEPLLP